MRYKKTLSLYHLTDNKEENALKRLNSLKDQRIEHSLLFVAKGTIELLDSRSNRTICRLESGGLALITSKQQLIHTSDSHEIWQLNFCPGCLFLNNNTALTGQFLQAQNNGPLSYKLEQALRPYLEILLKKLKFQIDHIDQSDIDIVRSLVILILAEVNQASLIEQQESIPIKVLTALSFIEHNYKQPISLKTVAKAANSSPAHLASLVKKHTNLSVGQWILQHRMADACIRLTHSQDSIDNIAEQTGWSDTTHFIRQFKKFKEFTPHQWKKKMLLQGIEIK